MQIALQSMDKETRGQYWTIDLGQEAVLYYGNDAVMARIALTDVPARFEFPNFTGSVKYLGITSQGKKRQFGVEKADLKMVRMYVNYAMVRTRPDAVRQARRNALLRLGGGGLMTITAVLVSLLTYWIAANSTTGGTYFVFHGLALSGLILAGTGIYKWRQAGQMETLAQHDTWTSQNPGQQS